MLRFPRNDIEKSLNVGIHQNLNQIKKGQCHAKE